MEYLLTLWILVGGQWLELQEPVPSKRDCAFVAEQMAVERGAEFAAFDCVFAPEV